MKNKTAAIIGYSGLIGNNLVKQFSKTKFNIDYFNSKNIHKISRKKKYDFIFCAALPAEKWLANKYPKKDIVNTQKLIKNLEKINTEIFFLISTIDVKFKHTYGRNRLKLEKFISKNFKKNIIIRLPGVFGKGLKKNVIYDLLKSNNLDNIYSNDQFQWYDLSFLYKDILKLINKKKEGVFEFYSEPVKNILLLKFFKKIKRLNYRDKPIVYNFKPNKGYYMSKSNILKRIKKFIKNYEV